MWQQLRTELHSQGLEIVTVALDTAGPESARPWIEAARPEHPSLIDQAHVLDELLGVINVPNAVWIDEEGMIVRPPEPAYPHRPNFFRAPPKTSEENTQAAPAQETRPNQLTNPVVAEVLKIRIQPELYIAALRDWVANGSASRYALAPEELLKRSRPRTQALAEAAASFELGQYLHRQGASDDAVPWFRNAHRLQPENWTYKRQAWTFADPRQGPTPLYDGDWLSDVRKIGAENYYPPLDM